MELKAPIHVGDVVSLCGCCVASEALVAWCKLTIVLHHLCIGPINHFGYWSVVFLNSEWVLGTREDLVKDIVAELRPDLGEVRRFCSSKICKPWLFFNCILSTYRYQRGLMILHYLFSSNIGSNCIKSSKAIGWECTRSIHLWNIFVNDSLCDILLLFFILLFLCSSSALTMALYI